jgi:hypothetical protein
MHQDYDEESTQQVYEHSPESNDINSYTSERQEGVLSGSSDTQHEVKQEIQKPPIDRDEYFQQVSRVISTQVGETIPQERVNEIVDYASHQLIYSPFGIEGTRDIMAITAATLANPTEAQKVLNHITGLHIDDTTPIDRRYEVSTTALTRLGLSGIKDEDLHNVLALVSTPLVPLIGNKHCSISLEKLGHSCLLIPHQRRYAKLLVMLMNSLRGDWQANKVPLNTLWQ